MLLERLGVDVPVVQAGMGGGVVGPELAAAVSEAGGLGTLATTAPEVLERGLAEVRRLTRRPIAVNLLLPFARRAHWRAASGADLVVTFWGRPRRRTDGPWMHQCGSVDEARAAHAAGADGVMVQGVEAGGHVRGATPALELFDQVRAALPDGYPLFLAGGIADRADVQGALEAGAVAAVLGTRFLMSEESAAHEGYKGRLVDGSTTILTDLFGLGWPNATHRVLPNDATAHWLERRGDDRVPGWVSGVQASVVPVRRHVPFAVQASLAHRVSARSPLLSPRPPVAGSPERMLRTGALYAGETVARIRDLVPAGDLVRALTP
ncbi:NAD(P)H-dependent flavin oxidoreductase [Aeromicrobium terrae]|uniref:Nitronate monooxygenase n=1 Tax=Aeromicrobium terrae TaxID=2498846 RepID=A0A5C8NPG9_9ACTN|nr:nitronate monooxygenase [Aeromicrobium terrae]TXL62731.1 nitronate monooxygenase [Aeromicrobium terrae]